MLDAEPPVPWPIFSLDALVNVELRADRPVPDGVNDHLQSGFVRAGGPLVEMLRCIDEESRVVRCVSERLEHRRRMGAE